MWIAHGSLPLSSREMEVGNEVQRLKMLKASYDSQHYSLQNQFMIKFPKLIAAANEKLKCVHADIKNGMNRCLQRMRSLP